MCLCARPSSRSSHNYVRRTLAPAKTRRKSVSPDKLSAVYLSARLRMTMEQAYTRARFAQRRAERVRAKLQQDDDDDDNTLRLDRTCDEALCTFPATIDR